MLSGKLFKKKKELNKTIKTSGNTCYLLKKKTEFTTLWKESLNIDGKQFHKYQQNKQSPLILAELTEHKKT